MSCKGRNPLGERADVLPNNLANCDQLHTVA